MIYLLRHGQTELNRKRILQGISDQPLNETGIRQAENTARYVRGHALHFAHIYTSPLIRAVQTARIVAGSGDLIPDSRLLELDCGPYEGTDMTNPPPEILAFFRDILNAPTPEGIEPRESVVRRLGSFLEDLKPVAEDGDILLSTHAGAIRAALDYLDPSAGGASWSRNIANGALFAFSLQNGAYTVPYEIDLTDPGDGPDPEERS